MPPVCPFLYIGPLSSLCQLLLYNTNSLPEIQGRRIDAHIILGKSIKEIAEAEGVHEESIRQSIKRGLERMKKTF